MEVTVIGISIYIHLFKWFYGMLYLWYILLNFFSNVL
jgi:hypothetical protein